MKTIAGILLLSFVYVGGASAFSFEELFRISTESADVAGPGVERISLKQLDLAQVRLILKYLPEDKRRLVLGDKQSFLRLVEEELARRSMAEAARHTGLEQDVELGFMLARAKAQLLSDWLLKQQSEARIPADFPTDGQVAEYYEQNVEQFRVGERIKVWQISLAVPNPADLSEVIKRAEGLRSELESGALGFSQAVERHSRHRPSRLKGGDMGLLKLADLRPELRDVLVGLAPDRISEPVPVGTAVLLLKRGARVPAGTLTLEEAAPHIRGLLKKLAVVKLAQSLQEQARKEFPVEVARDRIEAWYGDLRVSEQ